MEAKCKLDYNFNVNKIDKWRSQFRSLWQQFRRFVDELAIFSKQFVCIPVCVWESGILIECYWNVRSNICVEVFSWLPHRFTSSSSNLNVLHKVIYDCRSALKRIWHQNDDGWHFYCRKMLLTNLFHLQIYIYLQICNAQICLVESHLKVIFFCSVSLYASFSICFYVIAICVYLLQSLHHFFSLSLNYYYSNEPWFLCVFTSIVVKSTWNSRKTSSKWRKKTHANK